jgi:hypothetical protein
MSWRYTGLSILILLSFVGMRIPTLLAPPLKVDPSWFSPPSHDDPEGRLAIGYKLPLECANVWSLELIKGVSDTLAFELLDKRFDIMRSALNDSHREAIQKAHGIGEKTGERLLEYLDLTEQCELEEHLEIWRKEN